MRAFIRKFCLRILVYGLFIMLFGAGLLIAKTEWFITGDRIHWVLDNYVDKEIIDAKGITVYWQNHSLLDRTLYISFDTIYVKLPEFEVTSGYGMAGIRFSFDQGGLYLREIKAVDLSRIKSIVINNVQQKPESIPIAEKGGMGMSWLHIGSLQYLGKIAINVASLSFPYSGEEDTAGSSGSNKISHASEFDRLQYSLKVTGKGSSPTTKDANKLDYNLVFGLEEVNSAREISQGIKNISGNVEVKNINFAFVRLSEIVDSVRVKAGIQIENGMHASIDFTGSKVNDEILKIAGHAGSTWKDATYSLEINDAVIENNSFLADFAISSKNIGGSPVDLSLKNCMLNGNLDGQEDKNLKADLKCNGHVIPNLQRFKTDLPVTVPQAIVVSFSSRADVNFSDEYTAVRSQAEITISQTDFLAFKTGGTLRGQVLWRSDQEYLSDLKVDVDMGMESKKFSHLVEQMRKTPTPVPAPLNSFEGKSNCTAKGSVDIRSSQNSIPIFCRVDLKSRDRQKINLMAAMSLNIVDALQNPAISIEGDLVGDDIYLVMPKIQLMQKFPNVVLDSRFVNASKVEKAEKSKKIEEKKAKDSGKKKKRLTNTNSTSWDPKSENRERSIFSYNIRIKTGEYPIRLENNILEKPFPIRVLLELSSNKPMQGKIWVQDYPVEVLKKRAFVKEFGVSPIANSDQTQVFGEIAFLDNDYDITLKIDGTTDNPFYYFSSEPPLSENEIISILLYGDKPTILDEDQQKSVNETRAAMASGALSLISMYYLASSPIDSISYNPSTGMVVARVKLADDILLSLGQGSDNQSEVLLKKNIGGGWSVVTGAVQDSNRDTSKGIAMLQWGVRF